VRKGERGGEPIAGASRGGEGGRGVHREMSLGETKKEAHHSLPLSTKGRSVISKSPEGGEKGLAGLPKIHGNRPRSQWWVRGKPGREAALKKREPVQPSPETWKKPNSFSGLDPWVRKFGHGKEPFLVAIAEGRKGKSSPFRRP